MDRRRRQLFRSSTCELGGGMIVAWSKSSVAVVAVPLPRPSAEKSKLWEIPRCPCVAAEWLEHWQVRPSDVPLCRCSSSAVSSNRQCVPPFLTKTDAGGALELVHLHRRIPSECLSNGTNPNNWQLALLMQRGAPVSALSWPRRTVGRLRCARPCPCGADRSDRLFRFHCPGG